MSTHVIDSTRIVTDHHGYRIRFWAEGIGYIGSYFPKTKRAVFTDAAVSWDVPVEGQRHAAGECLRRYRASH